MTIGMLMLWYGSLWPLHALYDHETSTLYALYVGLVNLKDNFSTNTVRYFGWICVHVFLPVMLNDAKLKVIISIMVWCLIYVIKSTYWQILGALKYITVCIISWNFGQSIIFSNMLPVYFFIMVMMISLSVAEVSSAVFLFLVLLWA